MQWNAFVTFDADDEAAAGAVVSAWGLDPGTTVTLTPVPTPMVATVDESGDLKMQGQPGVEEEAPVIDNTLPPDGQPE